MRRGNEQRRWRARSAVFVALASATLLLSACVAEPVPTKPSPTGAVVASKPRATQATIPTTRINIACADILPQASIDALLGIRTAPTVIKPLDQGAPASMRLLEFSAVT